VAFARDREAKKQLLLPGTGGVQRPSNVSSPVSTVAAGPVQARPLSQGGTCIYASVLNAHDRCVRVLSVDAQADGYMIVGS
jgi:hypothetical protein